MIQEFNRSDRRTFTFPAVHPCEAVSPATLLDSLITLSRTISSYQSKFFPTQRRNARETLRQIGILLIFFEEIRERGANLSDSVLLCFSELHHAFQKTLFLFEDCTREGSRLWVLMKSHSVVAQFRELIRTVATALDVLPIGGIDLSSEIKELVELLTKQARKAKLELDPDDETAMKRVSLILNQFENKFEPDRRLIVLVLDYLEILSWRECHREINFLDEEISLECLEGNHREIPLLSSLVGLMSYCRGVLFETSEYGITEQSAGRCSLEMLTCLNPEDFRCPISLELMTDPVTVSTGQTYDRASIQKWLKSGNILCPKTGEKLTNTELVPNSTLRKLIQQFCFDNGISVSKSRKKHGEIMRTTIVAGSPAAEGANEFLAEFLANKLYSGIYEQKTKAAYEIRVLAKSNNFNRFCLIKAGAVPPLLDLLDSNDPSMEVNTISALLKLSKHCSGKKAIIENGGLKPILRVLQKGPKLEARQVAAATVFYLSSIPGYRKVIGGTPRAIPALVELIKEGTNCGKKNAVVAVFGLLLYQSNHQRVLAAGAVPVLISLIASPNTEELVTDSMAVLSTLAESFEGSIAILQAAGLAPVIRILQSTGSRAGKEYCVSILLSLCTNCDGDVMAAMVKEPSLMALLYSVLTDGTCHARKKASKLIKILHKYRETSSSGLTPNACNSTRMVHPCA